MKPLILKGIIQSSNKSHSGRVYPDDLKYLSEYLSKIRIIKLKKLFNI